MARPGQITGVGADTGLGAAAAAIVRARTADLFAQTGSAADPVGVDGVHDMRVATRRLRAVLEVFAPCFPRKRYAAALGDVKRLADDLGARRDLDVAADQLGRIAAALDRGAQSGVRAFARRLEEERPEADAVVAAALARIADEDLEGRLLALADAAERK